MSQSKKQFVRISSENTNRRDVENIFSHQERSVTKVNFIGIRFRHFEFAPWYGAGIDQITQAFQEQVERFIIGLDAEYSQNSIVTLCQSGIKSFLNYGILRSAALQRALSPADVSRDFVDGYIGYLDSEEIERISKRSKYSSAKSVLKILCERGVVTEIFGGDNATFPANPFPGIHKHRRGRKPLSADERKAFSLAVKQAVMPLFSKDAESTSNLLAYALLVIALHSGRNTTPLLEMGVNCLRPHPKSGIKFLVVFKRRAHAESKVALRDGRITEDNLDSISTLRPNVVDLINRVITLSSQLRNEAPAEVREYIWLYRRRTSGRSGAGTAGGVTALNDATLAIAIRQLVKNYDLRDADGKALKLNVSRLRQSFTNRVYEILDGDLVAAAAAAGNTVRVAGVSYLKPGDNATKNWLFMGMALTEELMSGTIGSTERTPVARCSNNKQGSFAPKNNEIICTSYLNCLRCRNLIVTGDDLYRLFSFYWRVLKERASMDPQRWKKQMAHIIRLIDRDVIEVGIANGTFKQTLVDQERQRAFIDPHPFWRTDIALTDLSTLGEI